MILTGSSSLSYTFSFDAANDSVRKYLQKKKVQWAEPEAESAAESEAEPEANDTEALIEAPEEEDDPDEAYLEAAPAEDVPTLEDYLSTLHCGRCGRNCYLSNPHCRTGRGKAETATAEYYAEYGDESEL